jgi:two-component system nitrate/nitrite response regulator NarL
MPAQRLLVVHAHNLLRRGLLALLARDGSLELVGESGQADDALRKAAALQPGLVLLDSPLPGGHGLGLIERLKRAAPQARVVLLTDNEQEEHVHAALHAGADGYVLKSSELEGLLAALHRVAQGLPAVSPQLVGKLGPNLQPLAGSFEAGGHGGRSRHAALSPREQDVLRHIVRGASNKEIGRRLDIAETTVKIHVQHILRKLGVSSRVQAAVAASNGALHV